MESKKYVLQALEFSLMNFHVPDNLVEYHHSIMMNSRSIINDSLIVDPNTGIKDFAIQVVKYLEDHYGEHNYKAFLEVVNDKLK